MRDLTLKDSYAAYAEASADPLPWPVYRLLCEGHNRLVVERVLAGHEVSLPERMGTLAVSGRKQRPRDPGDGTRLRGMAPDWQATKKLWGSDPVARAQRRLIYHANLHTDGVRYKFFWSKERVFVEYKTLYSFRASRGNKRAASALIMEGKQFRVRG